MPLLAHKTDILIVQQNAEQSLTQKALLGFTTKKGVCM